MTRLEELTLNLADDLLTGEEARELQALLAENEPARQVHIQILQIEAGLRARRQNLDLTTSIMARLRSRMAESIAEGVMKEIRAQPMPAWTRERILEESSAECSRRGEEADQTPFSRLKSASLPRRLHPPWDRPAVLALAASVVFFIGLAVWYFGPTVGSPVLAGVKGMDASIERGTEFIPAANGMALQPADVLHLGTNATVSIAFGAEKTRFELSAGTELKLTSLARGKHFMLASGTIEASVARQRLFKPMVITTPQAEARVLGTKFTLTATTNATRLEVAEGKVKLTRKSDGSSTNVPAGNYAVAAAGYELATLPLTGSILREYWTNLLGRHINDLLDHQDYPDRPNGRDYVDLLEVPAAGATNYGCRLAGYLHPPVTGQYIFWIAASPAAVVNLSKDENPANAVRVFGSGFDFGRGRESKPREWERKSSNARTQSRPITLVAGRRYYIEAVHKADDRVGHLAIAWTPPGGEREIIAGRYLSPLKPKPKEKKAK